MKARARKDQAFHTDGPDTGERDVASVARRARRSGRGAARGAQRAKKRRAAKQQVFFVGSYGSFGSHLGTSSLPVFTNQYKKRQEKNPTAAASG